MGLGLGFQLLWSAWMMRLGLGLELGLGVAWMMRLGLGLELGLGVAWMMRLSSMPPPFLTMSAPKILASGCVKKSSHILSEAPSW